jgi:CheY-like chemotaxis protein
MESEQTAAKKRVLVVEDDKFLGELLVRRMEQEGLNFVLKKTGEDGLEEAKNTPPDLILLDLLLPGIDGYEVLTQLKKNDRLAKIPVIVLTNLGQKAEQDKAFDLGATAFMVKAESDLDDIVKAVKSFKGFA